MLLTDSCRHHWSSCVGACIVIEMCLKRTVLKKLGQTCMTCIGHGTNKYINQLSLRRNCPFHVRVVPTEWRNPLILKPGQSKNGDPHDCASDGQIPSGNCLCASSLFSHLRMHVSNHKTWLCVRQDAVTSLITAPWRLTINVFVFDQSLSPIIHHMPRHTL